jgi:hypothetical protein
MVYIGSGRHGGGRPAGVVGKVGLSLFLFVFLAAGLLFEVLILCEFARTMGHRAWKKTPCTVVASEVQERQEGDEPYRFAVQYRYEHEGRTYEGSVYRRGYSGSGGFSKTEELVRKYPAGTSTWCYVNPIRPDEAVLKRDSMLIGLAIFFPLIFVCVGAGGIYLTWRRQPPEEARPIAPVAATEVRRKGLSRFGMAAFFGLFAVAGGAMLYPLGILPIAKTIQSRSWVETPCTVLRAGVHDHDSDDGTTYSVYILYQYEFDGQVYKSDRYDFMGGSSSGYQAKAHVVAAYQSAESPVCYVNPRNPSQAVLKRGLHAKLLLALFPLPFLLIGVGGLAYTVRGRRPSPAGIPPVEVMGRAGRTRPTEVGRKVLAPVSSAKTKFVAMLLAAVFWNGIISIFVVGAINDWRRGGFTLFPTVFLLPFVAIGLGLVAGAVYQLLAMLNPRPTLELSSGAIPLGGAAELRWSFSGQVRRIREFAIVLHGTEEARYRRGTDTHTDRNTFYEMELCRTSETVEIASGQVGVVIPQETMHSFEAENNKILWSLEVHGDIRRWPDVKESFRINVTPGIA